MFDSKVLMFVILHYHSPKLYSCFYSTYHLISKNLFHLFYACQHPLSLSFDQLSYHSPALTRYTYIPQTELEQRQILLQKLEEGLEIVLFKKKNRRGCKFFFFFIIFIRKRETNTLFSCMALCANCGPLWHFSEK